jgi:uncharacterized protein (DUF1697 family)
MSDRLLVMPRGINVGNRNRVPMAELRTELSSAGFADVTTILQSGNVLVTDPAGDGAEKVAARVEKVLVDAFDVSVPCVVRTAEQVRTIVEGNPLGDVAEDGSRHLVTFLSRQPPAEAVKELVAKDHSPEVLHLDGTEAYVWSPEGVKAMKLSYTFLEKRFGCIATARNWNTLEKIAAKI